MLDVTPRAPSLVAAFVAAIRDAGCAHVAPLALDAPALIEQRIATYQSKLAALKSSLSPVKK